MSNKRELSFIFVLLIITSMSFVFASFDVGEPSHEITIIYGPGENLEGWINISLDNELASSIFKDSEDNVISLIDLLKSDVYLKEGEDYNCSAEGCGMTYEESNSEKSKTFTLNSDESKTIGFKLMGEISDLTSVNFNIKSNAESSCKNQLKIDFFADETIDYGNNESTSGDCSELRDYGCFDITKDTEKLIMDIYCQRVELKESAGFKLGAWVEIEDGAEATKLGLFDLDLNPIYNNNEELVECELDSSITSGIRRDCEVSYLVTEPQEYYICAFNDREIEDTKTKIRGYYDDETGCGFNPFETSNKDWAFDIYAQGKKFAPLENIEITEDYPFEYGLSSEFLDYIYKTYEGYDCSDGCFIPIKLNSNTDNQEITIEDISLIYKSGGVTREIDTIYDLEKTSSAIDTGEEFMQISLSNANLALPTKFQIFDYELELNGKKVFEEKDIIIEKVPEIEYIYPSYGFNQVPTDFAVVVEELNNASIISYEWQFGNASPQITYTNKATHTFPNEGIFPIKIKVTDAKGKEATKIFYIEVLSLNLYFNEKLEEVKERLNGIETELSTYSLFVQKGLNSTLNIPSIKQKLNNLSTRYEQGGDDEVINEFLQIESQVPKRIYKKTSTSSVSYYPSKDYIEIGAISEILGGTYDTSKRDAYKDAVLGWHVLNVDSKVKYTQIAGEYDGRSDVLLSNFEFNFNKKGTDTGTIFIRQLENINFEEDYGEESAAGYFYSPLNAQKKINFYTTQDIGIRNLPVFVSSALSNLIIIEDYEEAEQGEMRWTLFFLIIFFLLIAGIIIYIVLQQWYKYKYEKYLFKDRNYLVNVVYYVDAQKKKGKSDSEIERGLRKAGWNSEQIKYVMKKYSGRRTGMLELPIEKVTGLFRKKKTSLNQGVVPSAPAGMVPRKR